MGQDRTRGGGQGGVSWTLLRSGYQAVSAGGGATGTLADPGLLRLCVRQNSRHFEQCE